MSSQKLPVPFVGVKLLGDRERSAEKPTRVPLCPEFQAAQHETLWFRTTLSSLSGDKLDKVSGRRRDSVGRRGRTYTESELIVHQF